jgi:hypothetical protein
MIPRISKGGRSFKGAFQYFCHDKGKDTTERVEWFQTDNMLTDDPALAWKVMAYTAKANERLKAASGQKASGNKLQKPVFAYSLAWHPEQNPDKEHMLATARKSLELLGLSDYETLIVAHRDEPQRHVHVIVNRVHPSTGIAINMGHSKRVLSDFARIYQKERGENYCPQREANYKKRKEGQKTRYADLTIQKAWDGAADGKAFVEALRKQGYELAQGRKRLVVVDKQGKILNPNRHLKNVKATDMRKKLGDFPLSQLFDAASLSQSLREQIKNEYNERQKANGGQAEKLAELKPPVPTPAMLNRLQDRHLEERRELYNGLHDKLEKELDALKEYYHVRERRQTIKELKSKTANPSWWRSMFGMARKDREWLKSELEGYREVEFLIRERMKYLERQREEAMAKQAVRHEQERQMLYEKGTDSFQPNPIRILAPQKMPKPGLSR